MDKDLDKIKEDILNFCDKYNCTLAIEMSVSGTQYDGKLVGKKVISKIVK